MCILVSARLQATAAPDAPAPMIRTSTGSCLFILGPECSFIRHGFRRHCEESAATKQSILASRPDGLFPASLAMTGRELRYPHISESGDRFTSGFSASINASFFERLPALICFTRVIASIMISALHTRLTSLQPYFAENPSISSFAALESSLWQVGRYTRVKRSVAFASHDVDAWLLHRLFLETFLPSLRA